MYSEADVHKVCTDVVDEWTALQRDIELLKIQKQTLLSAQCQAMADAEVELQQEVVERDQLRGDVLMHKSISSQTPVTRDTFAAWLHVVYGLPTRPLTDDVLLYDIGRVESENEHPVCVALGFDCPSFPTLPDECVGTVNVGGKNGCPVDKLAFELTKICLDSQSVLQNNIPKALCNALNASVEYILMQGTNDTFNSTERAAIQGLRDYLHRTNAHTTAEGRHMLEAVDRMLA